jgi:serine phosphatase RsbU (regulator of sigma subunit)
VGGRPTVPSILAFAPAPALAIAAGALGAATPAGIACALGAVGWLVADLVAIEPRLASTRGGADDIGTAFLRKAMRAGSVDEVARELITTLRHGMPPAGPPRAILIAPGGPEGTIRTIPLAGTIPPLGDPGDALDWLGAVGEPLDRPNLAAIAAMPEEEGGGPGAQAALRLLDASGCDTVMPLSHRGLLLGVLLVARPPERQQDPELIRLLRALRAYATAAVARTFLRAEVRQRGRLTRTVDLATAMQEAMMPVEKPVRRNGFELRGVFRPVAECGGDLWMWRDLGDGRVLLLIADATGHGAAPALLAAVAKGTVDALCQLWGPDTDPAQLLSQLGRIVYRAGKRRYLMTAFAAIVDVNARTITFSNAGQNFPYIVRAGETPTVETLVARGDTLGSAPRVRFELHKRDLAVGDRVFLYTDGIIDAGTPVRDPFGDKRLRAALIAYATERGTKVPELLLAELEKHAGGTAFGDDVTMLAFELTEAAG